MDRLPWHRSWPGDEWMNERINEWTNQRRNEGTKDWGLKHKPCTMYLLILLRLPFQSHSLNLLPSILRYPQQASGGHTRCIILRRYRHVQYMLSTIPILRHVGPHRTRPHIRQMRYTYSLAQVNARLLVGWNRILIVVNNLLIAT